MGRIFSFDEIHNGLVPSPEDFLEAKQRAFDSLEFLVAKGDIIGAMAFGSVAKGTPSERSDFDLLVITPGNDQNDGLDEIVQSIRQDTRVGIEPVVLPEKFARTGFHCIDSCFLLHLRGITPSGNTVGRNPVSILTPPSLPITRVHEQYLIQKLRKLREGRFASEADRQRYLQRALEAPMNTGRRTLQTLNALGQISDEGSDDGKPQVAARFRRVFEGTTLVQGFDSLLESDYRYSALLRETLSGGVSRSVYNGELNRLTATSIPESITWVSDVATMYIGLLEGNQMSPEGIPNNRAGERV